ncbi:glycosyltransferase [Parvularcula sp. ZS-1/3]|uniref:Glycosyltransferase n=1 Tax=Parvularcula mediterranea TaxID=2732508 RepID=A0A7Y3RMC4_9PROT|nr:glycosyltransferase [Parvularcula mediterranea]NNU16756.1 glycosyltransferase [Parvularcula mediterranea]
MKKILSQLQNPFKSVKPAGGAPTTHESVAAEGAAQSLLFEIDEQLSGQIIGWLVANAEKRLSFVIDDEVSVAIELNQRRPDVAVALGVDELCGFATILPRHLFDDRLHEVAVVETDQVSGHFSCLGVRQVRLRASAGAIAYIEYVERHSISGWANVPAGSELVCRVGEGMLEEPLTSPRRDVDNHLLLPTRTAIGFSFPVPATFQWQDDDVVEIVARHNGSELTLGENSLVNAPLAKPSGQIDGLSKDTVFGWATATSQGNFAVRLDGETVLPLNTSIDRPDVAEVFRTGDEAVGFELPLLDGFLDTETVRVELLFVSDSEPIVCDEKILSATISGDVPTPTHQLPARRRRAAVVCWDLAHNPAGRALVLYQILELLFDEVTLIGPMFPRFGTSVWAPIAENENLNIVTGVVDGFSDLEAFANEAASQSFDFVWLCKPRYPTLFIGLTIWERCQPTIMLDIDDYEFAFFKERQINGEASALLSSLRSDQVHLADLAGTTLAHSVIGAFDHVTVSNPSLQSIFGGTIVAHSRDESQFDAALFDRQALRASSGLPIEAKVVVFVGTVRRHKGVLEIARAIGKSSRSDLRLLVAGTFEDDRIREEIEEAACGRAILLSDVSFSELPTVLAMGDLVCLPQDASAETSYYQLPSKVADALAFGMSVLLNDLAPFENLKDIPGVFFRQDDESLEAALDRVLESAIDKERVRETFLSRFSHSSNAMRVSAMTDTGRRRASSFDHATAFPQIMGRTSKHLISKIHRKHVDASQRDLVILWKQVDSGLFGRRVDMVAEYLVRDGHFDRVIIIDHPLSLAGFRDLEKRAASMPLSNASIVLSRFVGKYFGHFDKASLVQRSFVYSNRSEMLFGRRLPSFTELKSSFQAFFDEVGLSAGASLLVCPYVECLDELLAAAKFDAVFADLIDDEREFATTEERRRLVEASYGKAISSSSAVFTNNERMRETFSSFCDAEKIHVVPNGVERHSLSADEVIRVRPSVPGGPVIGYVGNLRDRVDASLISYLARTLPHATIVLVGPTGGNASIEQLAEIENVVLTGALTYEDSTRIAAGFDIAIMPHRINELTGSMNPLKFVLYRELGLPIVSTAVSNLLGGTAEGVILTSDDPKEFTRGVSMMLERLKTGEVKVEPLPSGFYWSARVAEIAEIMGEFTDLKKERQSGLEEEQEQFNTGTFLQA